ncbi:MAG: hypothetical protein KC766_40595 [Myxococcales bacterium]|nr:hypothetical protein [Myxococcales bacterium]
MLKASWNGLVRGATRTLRAIAKAPFSTSHDPAAFADAKRSIDGAVGKLEHYTTFKYSLSEKQLGEIAELAVDIALTLSSLPNAVQTVARTAARLERLGGLYRRVANTGAFAKLAVPMQHRVVRAIARRAGIHMRGVKIKIVRDSSLVGRQFLGYTHPHAKIVELYPEAFSSVETLVKTLGHEYTHVYQIRTLGKPTSSAQLGAFEKAAYEVEETFWRYFQLHKTRGE